MTTPVTDRLAVARAAYDDVPLYDPKRTPVKLDLTDNTNLWGVPPHAERAIREFASSTVTRYPTLYGTELKRALADHAGVTPDMVVTGCGSDDILDSAMRAFGNEGDLVAASDPTFAMVPIFAKMNVLRSTLITELPDHEVDADALLATGAKLLYVCSPNNPTGALVARKTLEKLIDNAPGVLLIDEAYVEFAGVSNVDLLKRSDRVMLIRTMSKAFGLAGLRIGYALGHPSLVAEVEKSRGPYKVSALAEHVAVTALRQDVQWVEEHIQLAIENRDRLTIELLKLGLDPMPSSANFVCVPVPNCVEVGMAMREKGVGVRPFPNLPRVGDCLRISVGPWPLVEQCVKTLATAMKKTETEGEEVVKLSIFDYGAGNLHSLIKTLERPGVDVQVDTDPLRAIEADALVLPGVGAFPAATAALGDTGRTRMRDAIRAGLPTLGICLGMQVLFDESEEGGGAGLGVIPGRVDRLHAERIPQIGWNQLEMGTGRDSLLDASELRTAYFANSFVCRPVDAAAVVAWSTHEQDRYPAMVRAGACTGVQFHPEKSSTAGVSFVHAWLREVQA